MNEALDASRLAKEGWDIGSIRSFIDRKYRG
jgi:hypothetical protein